MPTTMNKSILLVDDDRELGELLTDFLGKASSWPDEWHPGQPFDNSYLIRNPNLRAKHLFDYDAAGVEVGLRPSEGPRVAQFRAEYLSNDLVVRHIKDPGQRLRKKRFTAACWTNKKYV